MNVQGANAAGSTGSGSQISSSTPASGDDAAQSFLAYMKETPAQRMEDAWLTAHHMTRQQYEALPPAQKAAIKKQMTQELTDQIKQKAMDQANKKNNIVPGG